MDPVSNADRLVALLRQRLSERAHARGAERKKPEARRDLPEGTEAVQGVAARVAKAGGGKREIFATIVEQLLADRFGAALVNEPRFQEIVGQVTELMAADEELAAMLEEVVTQVRG